MKTNILAIALLVLTALLATTNASTHHPHLKNDGDPAELFFDALRNNGDSIEIGELSVELSISIQTADLMRVADANKNGCLTREEFRLFLHMNNGRTFIKEMLVKISENPDSDISKVKFMLRMNSKKDIVRAEHLEKLFCLADSDNDQWINFEDLCNAVKIPTEATNPDNSTPT
ncbi:hypothetical protein IWQ61_010352 [Dispira simplex]|nr:hypothetical protein IWQ61_010352 [Dispira simplex]